MFAKAGFAVAILLLMASSPASAADLLECPSADLAVGMTGPQQLRPGEAGSFVIVVENKGDTYAWHPRLSVAVDPLLTVATAPGSCALTGNQLECEQEQLDAGELWEIQLPIQVAGDAAPGSAAYSTAVVASESHEANKSDNSAALETIVGKPLADFELTVDGPAEFAPGKSYDLTVKITNTGPAAAPTARLAGELDDHLIVERLPEFCALSDVGLACELTDLPPGSSVEMSIGVRLGARSIGGTELASQFGVTGTHTEDPDTSDNDVTSNSRIAPAQLSLRTSIGGRQPRPGAILTFTVEIENAAGAGTASDVIVTDRLPADGELLTADPSQGDVGTTGRVLRWSVGDLAAGESETLALRVRVPPAASAGIVLVNRAGVAQGPPARIVGACPGMPQESCSTTDPVLSAAPGSLPQAPVPSASPQASPQPPEPQPTPTLAPTPAPTPTGARPPGPAPIPTPEPTQGIAFVPDLPGDEAGSGLSRLMVVMLITSVLVAIRLFFFLRRR